MQIIEHLRTLRASWKPNANLWHSRKTLETYKKKRSRKISEKYEALWESQKVHENRDQHMADDGEQKSAALSYVFVIDDENHETHEIMCDMSIPKWLPPPCSAFFFRYITFCCVAGAPPGFRRRLYYYYYYSPRGWRNRCPNRSVPRNKIPQQMRYSTKWRKSSVRNKIQYGATVVSDTSVQTPKLNQINFILGPLGSKQIDRFSLIFIDSREFSLRHSKWLKISKSKVLRFLPFYPLISAFQALSWIICGRSRWDLLIGIKNF